GGRALAVDDGEGRVEVVGVVGGDRGEGLFEGLDAREGAGEVVEGLVGGEGDGGAGGGVRVVGGGVGGVVERGGDGRGGGHGGGFCGGGSGGGGVGVGRAFGAAAWEGEGREGAGNGGDVACQAGGSGWGGEWWEGPGDAGGEAVVDPGLGVEEVDDVFFFGVFVDEAAAVEGEEGEARADGEVDLGGEDAAAEEDFVAVAEGAEDVDAGGGDAGVDDASEEVGTLVDGVAGDEAAEGVCDDGGPAVLFRCPRFVAIQSFEEFDQLLAEIVWVETPVVTVIMYSELAKFSILAAS
ncbi:hypothetical protein Tdes44962_MAKER07295, partial [Teratosphaeria destructans]